MEVLYALGWPPGWFAEALRAEQATASADLLADKPWYPALVESPDLV